MAPMSELETVKAIEAIGDLHGVDVDGEAVLDAALNKLERDGVIERVDTGESGKATDTERGP